MSMKKYKELNDKLDKVLVNYDSKIQRLTENRDKAFSDLSQVKEERSQAMGNGNLTRARELKARVIDLTSDYETYVYQLQETESEKKAKLIELAQSIAEQVKQEESTEHAKDVREIIKICTDLYNRLEAMETVRAAGADVAKRAAVAAGLPVPADHSYLSLSSGKRLLSEIYNASRNVTMFGQGKQIYGMDRRDSWL